MCSSTTPTTSLSLLLSHAHCFSPRRNPFKPPITILSHYSLRNHTLRISSAIADKTSQLSWVSSDDSATDDFGGWELPQPPTSPHKKGLLPDFSLFLSYFFYILIMFYGILRRFRDIFGCWYWDFNRCTCRCLSSFWIVEKWFVSFLVCFIMSCNCVFFYLY